MKQFQSHTRPKLSIITVNLNNNEGLKCTLQSVKMQSFTDYEHIIIDAASTDGSVDTIRDYASKTTKLIYWISEKDKGIYDGMNKGIKQATGDYLIFMNSGDVFYTDILKEVDFDGTQYIYGDMLLNLGDQLVENIIPDNLDLFFFVTTSLPHQSCFIHRTLFYQKEYDLNYKIISDWIHSFQCIVLQGCSFKHIPLCISVCDGSGISSVPEDVQNERVHWMEHHLSQPMLLSIVDVILYRTTRCHKIAPLLIQTRVFKKYAISFMKFICKTYLCLKLHTSITSNQSIHKILINSVKMKYNKA